MIIVNEAKRFVKSSKNGKEGEKELREFMGFAGLPASARDGDICRVKPRRLLKIAIAKADVFGKKESSKKGPVGKPPTFKGLGG
jgi:hypothetical protein